MIQIEIELKLIRSGTGGGSWSLHTSNGDLVLEGSSDCSPYIGWVRPSAADYVLAGRLLEVGALGVSSEEEGLSYKGVRYSNRYELFRALRTST